MQTLLAAHRTVVEQFKLFPFDTSWSFLAVTPSATACSIHNWIDIITAQQILP
jgi:hypothetical protein